MPEKENFESDGPTGIYVWDKDLYEATVKLARVEARKAVASLAGLVLRRTQELHLTRLEAHNTAEAEVHRELARIFGEALQQFSDEWPGEGKIEDAG